MPENSGKFLSKLPALDRRIMEALFVVKRDRDEVCREFGVERDYLRVLLHRILQKFRSDFPPEDETGTPILVKKPKVH